MRLNLRDSFNILQLQNCILNVAKYIHDFCEENGIKYCLMGGSALGAIRHEGFIPWDDDLDIFMRPDDYEQFRKLFIRKGDKDNFYLQEWGESDGMVTLAKLRMNNTFLLEKDLAEKEMHHGVFVDIFILHNCPKNKMKRLWQYAWAKYLVTKGAANRNLSKSGLLGFLIKFCRLFPKRFMLNFALKQVYRFNREQSDYYCHFLGRARMKNGLYKKEYFEDYINVPFETIELKVNNRIKDYLTDRWGDYMKLPSQEEVKKFQHSWKWSDSLNFIGFNPQAIYPYERFLIS